MCQAMNISLFASLSYFTFIEVYKLTTPLSYIYMIVDNQHGPLSALDTYLYILKFYMDENGLKIDGVSNDGNVNTSQLRLHWRHGRKGFHRITIPVNEMSIEMIRRWPQTDVAQQMHRAERSALLMAELCTSVCEVELQRIADSDSEDH